jgi:hypothetical protein
LFHSSRNQDADDSLTGSRTFNVEDVALESDVNLDMLHHTCTLLSLLGPDGTTRVMVYGGRYSPCNAVNEWPLIFSVLSHDMGTSVAVADRHIAVTERQDMPESRWRHSAVCLKSSTPSAVQDYIVVFGGRTPDFKVRD